MGKLKGIARGCQTLSSGRRRRVHSIRATWKRFWTSDDEIAEGSTEYVEAYRNALAWKEPHEDADLVRYVRGAVKTAEKRANRRKIDFELDENWAVRQLAAQRGECAVSGLPLTVRHGKRSAFLPSIDRRNSRLGYTPQNCRFVCYAVNSGLNAFGDEIYIEVCRAVTMMARRNKS